MPTGRPDMAGSRKANPSGIAPAGHARNAYWYESQLAIDGARRHVGAANATSVQVMAGAIAAIVWAIRHPRRGGTRRPRFRGMPRNGAALPGPHGGAFADWTPLEGRGELFSERLDFANPWQLQNIRSRQWYGD